MSTSASVAWPPLDSFPLWQYGASEIVNEQALEERAHPSMISNAVWWPWGELWPAGASAILEEQALEGRAHPSMISNAVWWYQYEIENWANYASTILEEQALEEGQKMIN